ncbi:MAG: GIY-YIG nuclease family protein [Chloroflexota bacterium]
MTWHIYLIRCADNSLYTGITTDVERRFRTHSAGKGAKYVKARRPLKLVFQQEIGDRSLASKVEYAVKQLTKRQKERIVLEGLDCRQLVDSQDEKIG